MRAAIPSATGMADTPDERALRDAYGDTLTELAATHHDIVVFDADLARSTTTDRFRKAYPGQFYNVGIAEQNMVAMAAGLSLTGLVPFVTTYSIFIGRAFDQIRQSVAYAGANVKIVATHAGLAASFDGGSHQGIEDIALMRLLPNMTVLSPADYNEAAAAIREAYRFRGPVYIRLQKEPSANFTEGEAPFEIGRLRRWGGGTDIAIIGTGSIVHACLLAGQELKREGLQCRVLSAATLKPMDADALREAVGPCEAVVTAEEHLLAGGLHEAVCAALAGRYKGAIGAVGMRDRFGETGAWRDLLKKYGMTAEGVAAEARLTLARARREDRSR